MLKNWNTLSDKEYDEVWDYIFNDLKFDPSPYQSKKLENLPLQNLWFDTLFILNKDFSNDDFEKLNIAILNLLKTVAGNENIYALDWQHECFNFSPYFSFDGFKNENWPIQLMSGGDSIFFLTNDYSNGIYSDGVNMQICFWGVEFLKVFEKIKIPKLSENQMPTAKKIPQFSS